MQSNIELTLLKEEQIYGENRLKIFDVIGTKASVTDYAILCGAFVSKTNYVGEEKLENRTGWYWTKTNDRDNYAHVVGNCGLSFSVNVVIHRQGCVRPVVMFSQIQNLCQNRPKENNGGLYVEFGTFPQQSVSEQLEDELNRNLNRGFMGEEQKVYEYQGKKYARVRANTIEEEVTLSNGRTYKKGEYVWIAISPLRWYVDLESGIAFTEKLITPAQFNQIRNYKGDFENTDIYHLLNTHILKIMNISMNNVYSEQYKQSKTKDIKQFVYKK